MNEPQFRPLFDISITVDPPHDFGATPLGIRRIVPVTGGRFEGKRLSGIVMPEPKGSQKPKEKPKEPKVRAKRVVPV